MYSSKKSVFIGCFVWCKMFFRNTLVAHKSLINPYFMRFEVLKEIIRQQKSIPQIQGFPWICGIFLFVHFSEFLSVSNKLETK